MYSASMRSYLPTMTSLRVFEAAARHSSFTAAARELNLTQTAVSHQIRKLEEFLGTRLFVREHNTVRLTDAARDYLDAVRNGITAISEATGRTMDRRRDNLLYVESLPGFAAKCLLPHLHEFRRLHPDIMFRFGTAVSSETFMRKDYDVSIRWGNGDWPGFSVDRLRHEEIFPVCSPALLAAGPPLRRPRDLAAHTVIRTAFSYFLRDDWPLWLEAAGMRDLEFAGEIAYDLFLPCVEAAIQGLGVVMGRAPVIDQDLEAGRLVAPFETRIVLNTAYYVASPAERAQLPKVRLFKEWLLGRFGSHA